MGFDLSKISDLKEQHAELERISLGEYAVKSADSKGRAREEEPCPIRSEFQRDRDRILHCKAFRRLKHKTQVFISPQGDHYRTRMTHTLEVSQIARTIARALRLNEDLTEAIALGHDLGHTPFGHSGEEVLNGLFKGGFRHNEQSLRVVDIIENLNLTHETRDGILNHSGKGVPFTLEGQVVKIADRIAYLNHDIEDAISAGIITEESLPEEAIKILGKNKKERITFIIKDIILNSDSSIKMSPDCNRAMNTALREWMFEHVYKNPLAKGEEGKAQTVIKSLFEYYLENIEKLMVGKLNTCLVLNPKISKICPSYETEDNKERIVTDYIAGMTDRFAISDYLDKFVPSSYSEGFG